MINDEMRKLLEAAHEEEMKDYKKYLDLAIKAQEHENHEACAILHDIAHEEYTHAEHIAHILEK